MKANKPNVKVWFFDLETESELFAKKYGYVKPWLCFLSSMDREQRFLSISMKEMINNLFKYGALKNRVYAHNGSGFDYKFLVWELLELGLPIVEQETRDLLKNVDHIDILETGTGRIFRIEVVYKGKKYTFYDTLLIIPNTSVKDLGEIIGLQAKEQKGKIDYKTPRNYKSLSEVKNNEITYIKNDVDILIKFFEKAKDIINLEKFSMTASSEALKQLEKYIMSSFKIRKNIEYPNRYRRAIYNKHFFPSLKLDENLELRPWYRGGMTYLNPQYQLKIFKKNVSQYDVNSLYPSVMERYRLPYGKKLDDKQLDYYKIKNRFSELFVLYRVELWGNLRVKKGYHPFIPLKKTFRGGSADFNRNIILGKGNGKVDSLYLTTPELELFKKYYEGSYDVKIIYAFKTRVIKELKDFLKKFKTIKSKGGIYKIYAKLMMNSIYGKMAQRPEMASKGYFLNNKDEYEKYDYTTIVKKAKYLPLGIAISAYARYDLIKAIQANKDRFIYCDTDSIHLLGYEKPKGIKIHSDEFGKWKNEWEGNIFGKCLGFLYAGAKRYMVSFENKNIIKIAGVNNGDWKKQQTLESLYDVLINEKEILNAAKGKRNSIKFKGKSVKLKGCILVDVDKTLKKQV